MSIRIDKSLILNKIKSHYKFETGESFASFLGISATTLSGWSRRNTFDIELICSKFTDINANWLLSGEGNMIKTEVQSQNEQLNNIQSFQELLLSKDEVIKSKDEVIKSKDEAIQAKNERINDLLNQGEEAKRREELLTATITALRMQIEESQQKATGNNKRKAG